MHTPTHCALRLLVLASFTLPAALPACGGKAVGSVSEDGGSPSRDAGVNQDDAGGQATLGSTGGGSGSSNGYCIGDSSVSCPGSAKGYTCTGNAAPPSSQSTFCGAPVAGADDATSYCCVTQSPQGEDDAGQAAEVGAGDPSGGCLQNVSLDCGDVGATGLTCPPGSQPVGGDDLACTVPEPDGAGEDYCCFDDSGFSPDLCAPAQHICGGGMYGFRCVNDVDPPSLNSGLVCGQGTLDADGASLDYCCSE